MKIQNKKINKKMTIVDAMMANEKAAEVLFGSGLHCVGCGIAHMETVEQGCLAHGMNQKQIDKLIDEINKSVKEKPKKKVKKK